MYSLVVTTMNKSLSQSQIQMYRQQQNMARQQQIKMVSARATKTSASIIPIQTSQTSTTVNVRPKGTLNTRNITDTDVTNFIKRHQLLQQKHAQAAATPQTSISSAGTSIVKTSVQSLMLSAGTKSAISVATATKNINSQQQQFRHLTLQQPMLAHRKMPNQKVTQLSQVMVHKFFFYTPCTKCLVNFFF